MEDRKTLWIIVGIGVCVLVVVAVGFFWFLPTDQSITASAGSEKPSQAGAAGFDPVEWVRQDDAFPGVEETEEPAEDFVVVTDEVVYGIPEDAEDSDETADETITLDLPVRESVSEPEVIKTTAAAAPPVKTVSEPKTTAPAVKKTVKVTEYWIQAGSFSSLSKATEVKAVLNDKGASSTISTTNVNNTDYYRVRLGPYSDQMEADKFLTWVKAVKGFENSYISEVYVTR